MSFRYPGGLLTTTGPVNAQYPSGVWTQQQSAQYQAQGLFATDPQYRYTTLLLNGNGTNGAQNNTFLDSSTNNFTITRNGNTTQGSFSPYVPNGWWSNYFDGTSGQYLNAPANAAFNFGTGDFTIEGWVFPTSTSGTRPIVEIRTAAANSTGFALLSQSGATTLNVYTNGGFVGVSTNSMTTNQWNHVALTRSGNTWTYWINGVSGGSFTNSSTQSDGATTGPKIGGSTTAGEVWVGYLSNIRIVKGTAVYTGAFTPSTTPLTAVSGTSLLTCQGNRFLDASSNTFAITVNGSPRVQAFQPFPRTVAVSAAVTGGSGYFDGSGDYLVTSSSLSLGTGDFTAEAWWYPTVGPLQEACFIAVGDASLSSGFCLVTDNSRGVFVYSAGYVTAGYGYTPKLNAWNHVAVTRSGSTLRTYLNGAICESATYSNNVSGAIGVGRTANGYFTATQGFIAGSRILNTALYTDSTYTVPTSPATNVANTQFLSNFTNYGIFDSAISNDLETVGNAQVSTSVVKYGTGSMYFDGSGDRLYSPSSQNYNLGTGDFTIELWVNPINQGGHGSSNNDCLIDFRPGSSGVYGTLYIYSSGTGVYWYVNSANRITGGAIPNGSWTHVVVCRASGSTRLFLNGIQSGSTYSDSNNYLVAPIMVGEFNDGTGGGNLNGYIDELRITKGYARYTANFTPPIAPFPKQ